MSLAIRLHPEVLRSRAAADVAVGYMSVGAAFAHQVRIFFCQNLTDVTLLFSFDGVNDHFRLPAGGFLLLDVTANKTQDTGCFFAQGDRVYVKQDGVPTTGTVNVTVFYGGVL